jgi:hypothetical protein
VAGRLLVSWYGNSYPFLARRLRLARSTDLQTETRLTSASLRSFDFDVPSVLLYSRGPFGTAGVWPLIAGRPIASRLDSGSICIIFMGGGLSVGPNCPTSDNHPAGVRPQLASIPAAARPCDAGH